MQSGVTPLMKATTAGHVKVVELLLDSGANPDISALVCWSKENYTYGI